MRDFEAQGIRLQGEDFHLVAMLPTCLDREITLAQREISGDTSQDARCITVKGRTGRSVAWGVRAGKGFWELHGVFQMWTRHQSQRDDVPQWVRSGQARHGSMRRRRDQKRLPKRSYVSASALA
jgi:hypothetical protein